MDKHIPIDKLDAVLGGMLSDLYIILNQKEITKR